MVDDTTWRRFEVVLEKQIERVKGIRLVGSNRLGCFLKPFFVSCLPNMSKSQTGYLNRADSLNLKNSKHQITN